MNSFGRQVIDKMVPPPSPSIRTIFFDAGFTLLHSSVPHICQQICGNYGLVVEVEHIQSAMRQAEDYYQRSIQEQCTWEQEGTIQTMWINYYQHLLPFFLRQCDPDMQALLARTIYQTRELPISWYVYADVIPILKQLKGDGYSIGIISNWGCSLFSILSHHHLTPLVDCLVISAIAHCAKPSPAIFEIALERMHTSASSALYIGDNYLHDVIGARAAGIFPILLDRSALISDVMDCPVIHSLSDLLKLLKIDRLEQ